MWAGNVSVGCRARLYRRSPVFAAPPASGCRIRPGWWRAFGYTGRALPGPHDKPFLCSHPFKCCRPAATTSVGSS
ncbi:hypothetical protein AvCA_12540 [Azotobacter vinelandii CA]|uniref:Uncharacterized protein n=2 Tax=Azotobacter vinelandii TaxID=354 RepID=C1DQ29_AZOVD|nr:hypothetical protein Avin_12540 [Azotobacter vinelandii DJ]AGK15362.1 hypothetical protein AvCA_12540 [Azotobacter vinelandii CA]AGK19827.1 hypothetical protein AvCA6_12540 [Azotobacter vinelandii CA6]